MSKSKTVDLTSGPILKTLAELALPIMISSMLGTAYSIMDMAWIGLLGAKAVAGVGVGGMYVWLSQGLASLSRMGGQVNTAQACGRKDYDQARSYAAGSLQLTALSGILFAAVCVIFIHPLLGFFNLTDAETYTAARSYTLITCGLILFSYLNLTLTGLSTAQGDSRTPLLANFIGLAGNMILDPLLILGIGPFPRLEVAGAAIATVSSQILVFVVMVLRIRHSRLEPNVLQHLNLLSVFPKEYYKHIFRIGFPTAIQGSIYCFISMVLTRMVSGYGAAAIATQRVGGQIESVSWNTADGFASALNAFIAQNYGARKKTVSVKVTVCHFAFSQFGACLSLQLFVFLPEPIARLFFHEKEALDTAVNYLVIIGFSEVFMSIELMTVGALSGLGRTRLSSTISVILTGSRIPLALILTHAGMGLNGVWWALTISSIVKGIVFTLTFRHISRRLPEKV